MTVEVRRMLSDHHVRVASGTSGLGHCSQNLATMSITT
jgi:hypothetical protein